MPVNASFRTESEILVGPALDRLRKGDPGVVAFLYHHYDYLHDDVQRQVFQTIWERLRRSQDQALATRLHTLGADGLATDFPLLAGTMHEWADDVLIGTAQEVMCPLWGNIQANSPRAAVLRDLVVGLPLVSIYGAKLRKAMAARKGAGHTSLAYCDALLGWTSAALKRLKSMVQKPR